MNILLDALRALACCRRAENYTHALRTGRFGNVKKPFSFLLILNLMGGTNIGRPGQQHHAPPRNGQMQGSPWSLGAYLLLGNLHRQHLSHMDRSTLSLMSHIGFAIPYIEIGILAAANVHKSRLHARQDILHHALVDISYQVLMVGTLQLQGY